MSSVAEFEPRPGLVIRYAYLWRDEAERGKSEGKDRPCVVVLAVNRASDGVLQVVVAPITHSPPTNPFHAVEVPQETKSRLGLDDAPSWIKTTELNVFAWPGPDLRPIGRTGERRFAYGYLPKRLTDVLLSSVRSMIREQRTRLTQRDTSI